MTAVAFQRHPCFAVPLHAVDELTVEDCGDRLTLHVIKVVDASDPYLPGHFPGFTVFPGVFVIECLRQAVAQALGGSERGFPELRMVHSARFLAPLLPGDQMILKAAVGPMSRWEAFPVDASCQRSDGVMAARLKVEFSYGEGASA